MKTNAGGIGWALPLLAILLIVATLSGCRGVEETPEETPRPAPTATLIPEPTPESPRMSLDEYAAFCAELEAGETTEEEGEITYGEFSRSLELYIELLESIIPPEEVSVWHDALLAGQRELKAAIDEYPGSRDDGIDLEQFFSLLMTYYERLSETAQKMDPALRNWLVAAGCIDEEMAAAASDAWWDEGIEKIERAELTVGVGMEGVLDEEGETDHFTFQAEEGKEYLIEAVWEEMSSIRVELTDGLTFSKIRQRSRQPLQFAWTAGETGEYHLNVTSDRGTGSYTVTVSKDALTLNSTETPTSATAPAEKAGSTPLPTAEPTATPAPAAAPGDAVLSGPANVRYAFEGQAIRVHWEAVEGASYYILYHDDSSYSNCSLHRDGRPRFCDELATNLVGTNYLHTEPEGADHFYWVVACNQKGCSEIDSENPAAPAAERPPSPATVTFAWEGTAIRVSWQAVDGADYYNVYHDHFFDSNCSLRRDGRPRFCEELAANLVETNYLHTAPDRDRNFYWVVACNQGGCSEIISESPAIQGEAGAARSTEAPAAGTAESTDAPAEGPDRATLVAFYHAMDGANWRRNSKWLSDEPLDRWYGVTTDGDGRVTGLSLSRNDLNGEIPAELGSLSHLTALDLSENDGLHGAIPAQLGNLSRLEILNLSDQTGQGDYTFALSGEIPPELGNLSHLRRLDLAFQRLSGEIPAQLGNLLNLNWLNLSHNQLSGEIPSELGGLSKVTWMGLHFNQMSGQIPASFGGLSALRTLLLGHNELDGEIPSGLGDLTELKSLWLAKNELSGEIPSQLGQLPALEDLDISGNMLSGNVPPSIGKLIKLEAMDLSNNQLSGEIPPELSGLAVLRVLDLSKNRLTGEIPAELGLLPNLEGMDLSDNALSGRIPQELTDLWTLRVLFVRGNRFSGCVPYGLRILLAKTLGEHVRGFASRWLPVRRPAERSDIEKLDIPVCAEPELYRAVRIGDAHELRSLIQAGVDINEEYPGGRPLLFGPIFRSDSEIVQILVDAGADVNAGSRHGNPLLHLAIFHNDPDIVQILVDGGADVNAVLPDGRSLLHVAKWFNRSEIVQILEDAGAKE